jgi:hypothetical protein
MAPRQLNFINAAAAFSSPSSNFKVRHHHGAPAAEFHPRRRILKYVIIMATRQLNFINAAFSSPSSNFKVRHHHGDPAAQFATRRPTRPPHQPHLAQTSPPVRYPYSFRLPSTACHWDQVSATLATWAISGYLKTANINKRGPGRFRAPLKQQINDSIEYTVSIS